MPDTTADKALKIAGWIIGLRKGTLVPAEREMLEQWLSASEANRVLFEELTSDAHIQSALQVLYKIDPEPAIASVMTRLGLDGHGSDISSNAFPTHAGEPSAQAFPGSDELFTTHRMPVHRRSFFRYAAAIIALLGAGAYFYFQPSLKHHTVSVHSTLPKNDIPPGKDGAILTLADGTTVVLDSLGNGVVANQSGTQIILNNGQLAYNSHPGSVTEVVYNTMSTPKGRQFRVILPDGTKVWLNAASSITYPTAFTRNERTVSITGEAYFEVKALPADKEQGIIPFIVRFNSHPPGGDPLSGNGSAGAGGKIEVLGTHFNVNAYDNASSVRATLLEGSVRVTAGPASSMLKPGQQAQIYALPAEGTEGIRVVSDLNTDEVMAWKNGLFNFNGDDLKTVMREIERWYDIQVKYEGPVGERKFRGKMQRGLNLSQILEALEYMNVRFRMEGRTLIIEK